MVRDVKVFQAALDNLVRRGSLPANDLSLSHAENWVAALTLTSSQLTAWAYQAKGYSIKQLTSIVMTVGINAGSMRKKEQQELIALLQDQASLAHA